MQVRRGPWSLRTWTCITYVCVTEIITKQLIYTPPHTPISYLVNDMQLILQHECPSCLLKLTEDHQCFVRAERGGYSGHPKLSGIE